MKASTLVRKIEKAGGHFELQHGLVYALKVPARYRSELQKMRSLVLALIREREATVRWELSGRNPAWWRDIGPAAITPPREDVWSALKRLLAAGSRSANDSNCMAGQITSFGA